jgi:hypothetical protein
VFTDAELLWDCMRRSLAETLALCPGGSGIQASDKNAGSAASNSVGASAITAATPPPS